MAEFRAVKAVPLTVCCWHGVARRSLQYPSLKQSLLPPQKISRNCEIAFTITVIMVNATFFDLIPGELRLSAVSHVFIGFASSTWLSLTLPPTLSRSSLPALKCGTYLADTMTVAPVLGLRPFRGGRWLMPKLPNPRISTRPPFANVRAFHREWCRQSVRCL